MRTFRIRRDSWSVLAGILRANEPFKTAGSMRGQVNPSEIWGGHMPNDEYELLKQRHTASPIEYAVYSYATIIGYRIDGVWYVPDCTYSITTTIQQNKLRVAVGDYVS